MGSVLSTQSPVKGEISGPGSAVPDLTASLGIWAALACSRLCGALAVAQGRSKLADNFVAQEPKLACKAEIPLVQNPTERALSGGGASCWGQSHLPIYTYRQSPWLFLISQKNNRCSRFTNFYTLNPIITWVH